MILGAWFNLFCILFPVFWGRFLVMLKAIIFMCFSAWINLFYRNNDYLFFSFLMEFACNAKCYYFSMNNIKQTCTWWTDLDFYFYTHFAGQKICMVHLANLVLLRMFTCLEIIILGMCFFIGLNIVPCVLKDFLASHFDKLF